MRLSEFKVGDKVRAPEWPEYQFDEILCFGIDCIFMRNYNGTEFLKFGPFVFNTWELYQEPKKTVKRYAYEINPTSIDQLKSGQRIVQYFNKEKPERCFYDGYKRVLSLDYEIEEEPTHPSSGAI